MNSAEPDSREVYDVEKGFSTGLSAEPDNTVDNEELKDVFDALWESYVEDDLEGLAPSGIRLRKELIAYAKALNEGGMPLTALEQENERLTILAALYRLKSDEMVDPRGPNVESKALAKVAELPEQDFEMPPLRELTYEEAKEVLRTPTSEATDDADHS